MSLWSEQVAKLDRACLAAFGREAIYLPEAGGSGVIRAIFQRTREPEDASPGIYAVLFVWLMDLPARPVRGDEVEIVGVRYKVFDVEADSEGAAVLRLRQTS